MTTIGMWDFLIPQTFCKLNRGKVRKFLTESKGVEGKYLLLRVSEFEGNENKNFKFFVFVG